MQVKVIGNEDLLQLLALQVEMFKAIDKDVNEFGAINTLINEINTKEDFIAVGLYKENKLVGFMSGYKFAKNVFHFSGICVIIKNNKFTKKLIDFILALIKDKGYSAWRVDATNGNISSIIEKYGAEVKSVTYYKEIV